MFPACAWSIDVPRISFLDSSRTTPLSTMAYSKSHIPFSRDGDPFSGRISCTWKSIMFSKDSAALSWLFSRWVTQSSKPWAIRVVEANGFSDSKLTSL